MNHTNSRKSKKLLSSLITAFLIISSITFIFASTPLTKSWTKDPFGITDFVNSRAGSEGFTLIPTGHNGGAMNYDLTTAQKICNLAGYFEVINYDCVSNYDRGRCGFFSCYDNSLGKWNPSKNDFDIYNACNLGNKWISSLTCGNPFECYGDSDCGQDYHGEKYCLGTDIYQDYHDFKCTNNKCFEEVNKELIKICDYNCDNGECGGECSQNSDCGVDSCIGPNYCYDNDVYQDFLIFTCNNPGQNTAFCSNGEAPVKIGDCGDSYCESYGNNYCFGNNVYHKRTCYDKGCRDSGCFVEEYVEEEFIEKCDFKCKSGECVSPTQCEDNIDNDDDNLIDSEDPGCWDDIHDSSSYNPHLDDESRATVICCNDSECGTSGYIGEKYLIDNNVYQDYQTFLCLNPGLGDSECQTILSSILIFECGNDYCEEYGEEYCKNGDVYHKRTCYDKGYDYENDRCFTERYEEETLVEECIRSCSRGECRERGSSGRYYEEEEYDIEILTTSSEINSESLLNQKEQIQEHTQVLHTEVLNSEEKPKFLFSVSFWIILLLLLALTFIIIIILTLVL